MTFVVNRGRDKSQPNKVDNDAHHATSNVVEKVEEEAVAADIELWVKDEKTGETCFFAEKIQLRKSKNISFVDLCQSTCDSLLMFIFHFDIKIKNCHLVIFNK